MMKKLCLIFVSVFTSLSLTTSVFAAGFALTEPSARANALGGATVAQGGDASTLFTNPAAMTQLPGVQTELAAVVLQPRLEILFPNTGGAVGQASMANNTFVAPSAFVTSQLSDKLWMGVGGFTRFGLGTEFDQKWPGRYNAYYSKVASFEVNPNVAYKFTDKLSLSAGVSAMYFTIKLQKKINSALLGVPGSDIDQTLKADSVGYGVNAGLHYQALDWMSLGFSYRSPVRQKVDGNAYFAGTPSALGGFFPSGVKGHGTITLPPEYFFGVAIKPAEKLSWEFGGVMYGWSTYDALTVEFEQPVAGSRVNSTPKNWKDSWRFQTGLEYKATNWLDLRLSYVYDQSPVPNLYIDYILPDSDRHVVGVGAGVHGKSWFADVSFNYLKFINRDIAARPASFVLTSEVREGYCLLYGLDFGFKF